jgi:adenine-specific DNA-methyltransferase
MSIEKFQPSYDVYTDRFEKLKAIVPEAFADGKINWDKLKECFGNFVEEEGDEVEHYAFTWPGKREARRLAGKPPQGTLVPALGEGVDEDKTDNIFIEGDNLEVLKLLQKSYAGKIKLIYIDPPYNTGKDFIYNDNFDQPLQEYLNLTKQVDDEGNALVSNKKADGRFHSRWLNMMSPRLRLAKQLLKQDGAIFVSCDENEMARLRLLMDDVFGPENFIAEMVWAAGRKNDSTLISISHEYIVCYACDKGYLKEQKIEWRQKKKGLEDIYAQYERLKREHGDNYKTMTEALKAWYKDLADSAPAKAHKHYSHIDKRGIYFPADISWPGGGGPTYEVVHPITQRPVRVPSRGWMTSDPQKMKNWILDDRVHFGEDESSAPCIKSYLRESEYQAPYSVFYQDGRAATKRLRELMGGDCFDFPKDEEVLQEIVALLTKGDDMIFDFFAGSGTTGHAVTAQNIADGNNRRYILVQLPELLDPKNKEQKAGSDYCDGINKSRNIAELTKERIRRVIKKIREESKLEETINQDLGFKVFKLQSSHFKEWKDYAGRDVKELMELFTKQEDALVDGWKPADLLVEVMLQEGFPLNSKINLMKEIDKNKVYKVTSDFCEHPLFICFDGSVEQSTIKALPLSDKDIFICLDSALTDEQKVVLADKGVIKTI